MRGCRDCCRSLWLSLLVKNLILVWLVSTVLGSPSLKHLLSGVLVFIAGESADVKATVATLKAAVAEDMYQCDVSIYKLSSKTPLYTSSSHLVSICSATAFDTTMPRYVAFNEGPMSSVMPVEIFSYLLSLVPVPERAGNWFLPGTLSVYFASMMSTRLSKECNVVCALLGEETDVPDDVVQSIRAATANADRCPPPSHARMCTMTWGQVFLWIVLRSGM